MASRSQSSAALALQKPPLTPGIVCPTGCPAGSGRIIRAFRYAIVAAVAIAAAELCCPAVAAERPSLEYQVKASLLYNFLSYVEFPADAFEAADTEMTICVFGPDPFGPAFDRLRGEIVNGKKLDILRGEDVRPETLLHCQVVFFSAGGSFPTTSYLHVVSDRPVLTVSDTDRFVDIGGIVEFTIVDDKVGFKINHAAAKRARLVISSHLLRLARQVVAE